jgi:ATP-dependent Clp protease protease subunit
MSLYEEKPKATTKKDDKEDDIDSPYSKLSDILSNLVDYDDSVIYLNGDITSESMVDFMIKVRSIISNRDEKTKDDPINVIINSDGGDVYDMLGLVDYIESLSVKVNTICRGKAFSAAAILLAHGTGTRMSSKRSSVMFHQSSSFIGGKMGDISAYVDNVKTIENIVYELLEAKTKKDASWWKDKMKTDFFATPEELLEYGVIDQII